MAGSGLFAATAAGIKEHLIRGRGVAGFIQMLRSMVGELAAVTVEEFTNPALADVDAIKTAAATIASATTYLPADFDGVVGKALMATPRNITVTTAGVTPANAPATAKIYGVDVFGNPINETITVSQIADTAAGSKVFAQVTKIELPAADGVAATLAFGFGDLLGLSKKIKSRAGLVTAIKEIAVGAVVTTGTFVDGATAGGGGSYAPAAAPDGTKDYAVYYEYDPS